jgi:hypothetical protein
MDRRSHKRQDATGEIRLKAAAGVRIWHVANVERTAEMYATARCAFEPSGEALREENRRCPCGLA